MYDELVKALRGCVLSKPCDGCPYYDPNGPTEKCATMNIAAADAIEDLFRLLNQSEQDKMDNAAQLGGILEGTTDYQLTISLAPGNGETIFQPTIKAERAAVVMPAMKYYYDLDGEPPKEETC